MSIFTVQPRPSVRVSPLRSRKTINSPQQLEVMITKLQQVSVSAENNETELATVKGQLEDRISAVEAIAGIGEGKRVFGADIYVQPTEPTASGDWVWIDTSLVDIFNT